MAEWASAFFAEHGALLAEGVRDTLVMTLTSTALAYVLGVPLGVVVHVTTPGSLAPRPVLNRVLGWVVNTGRSIPFIILLVALIPFTRLIVGTSIGTAAAVVPLVVAAVPFVARLVEGSLAEVGPGFVEAALACGASTRQVVFKVLLSEALPSLVRGCSIAFIALLGYSAMAGAIGAGGLGDIAVRYGYYRYQDDVMVATVVALVVIVHLAQTIGDRASRALDRR